MKRTKPYCGAPILAQGHMGYIKYCQLLIFFLDGSRFSGNTSLEMMFGIEYVTSGCIAFDIQDLNWRSYEMVHFSLEQKSRKY